MSSCAPCSKIKLPGFDLFELQVCGDRVLHEYNSMSLGDSLGSVYFMTFCNICKPVRWFVLQRQENTERINSFSNNNSADKTGASHVANESVKVQGALQG